MSDIKESKWRHSGGGVMGNKLRDSLNKRINTVIKVRKIMEKVDLLYF